MKLPNCPVCLTSEHLLVQKVDRTDAEHPKVTYHCNNCGYKNVTEPTDMVLV